MKICFDFNNLMSYVLGPEEGITAEELKALTPEAEKVHSCLKEARSRGEVPFTDLPYRGYQLPLGGRPLNQIFCWEKEATALALAQAGRPNCTLILPQVIPFVLGQLLFFLEVVTVLAGGLFGVNPYDQPGVEELKRILYGLMGRAGYAGQAQEVSAKSHRDNRFVV